MVYIGIAIVRWSKTEETGVCNSVEVAVNDSLVGFISEENIKDLLEQKKMNPVGQVMKSIDLNKIESLLEKHPFITDAECYKAPNGTLRITVTPRFPVMRIMSNGKDYFIDAQGTEMKGGEFSADVVVATGNISSKYAKRYLAEIGNFLKNNKFWDSQIEQLNVLNDGSLEMIPRIGGHVVNLGRPVDVDKKLARLKVFYKKVLNEVGWNKYERIDLQYSNQIVCTKAE